jgi:hypothetical protein
VGAGLQHRWEMVIGNWQSLVAGPARSAAEIVQGLVFILDGIYATISSRATTDWQQTLPGEGSHEPAVITRPWVIWHLIEHDMHHGGEISLSMGMNKLKAPDL